MSVFVPNEEDSIPLDLAKGLVASTIITIGVTTGFVVVGYVIVQIDRYRKKKAEKSLDPK